MLGYVLQKPQGLPETVWACKTCVSDYSWQNRNSENMMELAICTASERRIYLENRAPMLLRGANLSCVMGALSVQSDADTGVSVEIASLAVRFPALSAELREFEESDLNDPSVLLIPLLLQELPERELCETERLFHQYIHESVRKTASSEMLCCSILFELLGRMDRIARRQSARQRSKYSQYYVMKADSMLRLRYAERLSLSGVARELGITPAYLSMLYKRSMGICFSSRLLELRIKEAERLLTSSALSVSEIAERVGFGDESNLRKRFKEHFGTGMREYRCIAREQTLYHPKPLRHSENNE